MGILIVDDTPANLFLLENILEEEGYTDIFCAGSAQEGLRLLRREEAPRLKPIDIILLDVVMPGMDGIEICRRLKAEEWSRDIPVVVMTVRDDPEVLEQAFAAGATDYLVKPIKVGELLGRVRSTLQLKREIDRRKDSESQLVELTDLLAYYHRRVAGTPGACSDEKISRRLFFETLPKREWD